MNLLRAVNSLPLLTSSCERHAVGGAAASRHGSWLAAHPPYQPLLHLSNSIDSYRNSTEGWAQWAS